MVHGERIIRMAGQHSFEVLDRCVIVEIVKPLERDLVLRISGAECGLAESVGSRAQASQAHQNCKVENRAKPGRGESHGSLVYRVSHNGYRESSRVLREPDVSLTM